MMVGVRRKGGHGVLWSFVVAVTILVTIVYLEIIISKKNKNTKKRTYLGPRDASLGPFLASFSLYCDSCVLYYIVKLNS